MAREKKQEEGGGGAPEWMTTYGDLMTLLLCFFVMLYASSNIDVSKFEAMAASFRRSTASILPEVVSDTGLGINSMLGNGIMEMPTPDHNSRENSEIYNQAQQELRTMAGNFQTYFAENNMSNEVGVELTGTYVKLVFSDGILFDKGSAEIKLSAMETLGMVAEQIRDNVYNDEITVEGHADSDPINTFLYKDNLDLSSARANSVVRYFINEVGIDPYLISGQGFGEYRPIAENDTEDNKTKNRRVEIKIMSSTLTNNN